MNVCVYETSMSGVTSFLDPLTVELLYMGKALATRSVDREPVSFTMYNYPSVEFLGRLPAAAVGSKILQRTVLCDAVGSKLGETLSESEECLLRYLDVEVLPLLERLVYCEQSTAAYVSSVFENSTPLAWWFHHWQKYSVRQKYTHMSTTRLAAKICQVLRFVETRLMSLEITPVRVAAKAFGMLSVLFSLPGLTISEHFDGDRHDNLREFCRQRNIEMGCIWPIDCQYFLCVGVAAGSLIPRREWWQLWGFGRRKPRRGQSGAGDGEEEHVFTLDVASTWVTALFSATATMISGWFVLSGRSPVKFHSERGS